MQYIIGVDAGGTSSKAASYNLEGEMLDYYEGGFGNFAVDIYQTKIHIEEVIDLIIKNRENNQLLGIYLGISGIGSYHNIEDYQLELTNKYQTHVELHSDIKLAKEASLQGNDGIMLVLGTGFSCFGSYQTKELLYGGWGHIIGDPCSGYAIGISCIRNAIVEYEKGKLSQFSKDIMMFYGVSSIYDFKEIVYQYPKEKVARVAKLIIEQMHSNQIAFSIIVNEINKMMEVLERLCRSLRFHREVHIVGNGSIFENLPMIKMMIEANLFMYELVWHINKEATYGAYVLYQKQVH